MRNSLARSVKAIQNAEERVPLKDSPTAQRVKLLEAEHLAARAEYGHQHPEDTKLTHAPQPSTSLLEARDALDAEQRERRKWLGVVSSKRSDLLDKAHITRNIAHETATERASAGLARAEAAELPKGTKDATMVSAHFLAPIPEDDPEVQAAQQCYDDAVAQALRVTPRISYYPDAVPDAELAAANLATLRAASSLATAYERAGERIAQQGLNADNVTACGDADNAARRWARNSVSDLWVLPDGQVASKENIPERTARRAAKAAISAMRECDERGLEFDVLNGDEDSEGQRLINAAMDRVWQAEIKRSGWKPIPPKTA